MAGSLAWRGAVLGLVLAAMIAALLAGWDGPLRRALAGFGAKGLGYAWGQAAYWLGLGGVQIGAALAVVCLALWARRLEWRRLGLGCLWAVVLSGVVSQVLKHLVGRPRPRLGLAAGEIMGPTLDSDLHSFPSGHASTSFALAVVLAARWPRLAPLFYGVAVFIAAGRVVSGSHYLSDVLAGAALGLMVGWFLTRRSAAGRAAA